MEKDTAAAAMNKEPLVTIFMITYNHEKFIAEAIESALMQQTDFSYKLIIGEDCSTDNTRAICREYQKKYPDKIELILNEKNLGAMGNSYQIHYACQSKYVAMLEGDDFWTHPLKLQKQVDFMEANPGAAACFHQVNYNTMDPAKRYLMPKKLNKNAFDIYDVIAFATTGWQIMTSSILYRKAALPAVPHWYTHHKIGDITVILLAALNGTINYIDEVLGAYRENPTSLTQTKEYLNYKVTHELINVYLSFNKHTGGKYRNEIYRQLLVYLYDLIYYYKSKNNKLQLLKQTVRFNHYTLQLKYNAGGKKSVLSLLPEYLRYSLNEVKTS